MSSRYSSADDRASLHAKLDELLDQAGAHPAAVSAMRMSACDTVIKNNDGEAEVIRSYGVRLESVCTPAWPAVAVRLQSR
jgi:hypothetical protein